MDNVEKTTQQTIDKGGVLALLYFDIHADSKETVQQIGTGFVQDILKKEGVVYALGEIDEPVHEKDIYSTNVQIKILTKSFLNLVQVCSVNSPFTVEILKPDEMNIKIHEAQEILTNVATTTAEYKKYIIEKLAKPEDLEKYKHFMEKKKEMGEKILKEGN